MSTFGYWIGIWSLLVYSTLARLAAFGILKQRLQTGSLLWSTTPPYVKLVYFRNRAKIGSRRMDVLVASLLPTLALGIVLLYMDAQKF